MSEASRHRVVSVTAPELGTELSADAGIGDALLELLDPGELDMAGGPDDDGGYLLIGTEVHSYSLGAGDSAAALTDGVLAGAYVAGEPVYQYPRSPDYEAHLQTDAAGEELIARVPHHLADRLALGIREDVTTAETVECVMVGGELVVSDVLARAPVADSTYTSTGRAEEPSIFGLDPIPSTYTALDGEVTVAPERDCVCEVDWAVVLEFYNEVAGYIINGDAFAALLVGEDGGSLVPVGLERQETCVGKWDPSGPLPRQGRSVGDTVKVDMKAGVEYQLVVGVKAAMTTGSAKVPALKVAGLTYGFVGD